MSFDAALVQFPTLSTRRLQLRQLRPTDAEAMFAIKGDLEVTKHYGQEPHEALDDTLAWIQRLQASYGRGEDLAWSLTLKGEDTIIGAITLWNLDPASRRGEIGYELHPAYGKQGLMTEALTAILTFGFTELELHRIEATPFADNAPSESLLLKLGFQHEGTLRQRHSFRGEYKDQLYLGLLWEDWLKSE
jgi:ribosomal-protein-alanine N-acetyltransferase